MPKSKTTPSVLRSLTAADDASSLDISGPVDRALCWLSDHRLTETLVAISLMGTAGAAGILLLISTR